MGAARSEADRLSACPPGLKSRLHIDRRTAMPHLASMAPSHASHGGVWRRNFSSGGQPTAGLDAKQIAPIERVAPIGASPSQSGALKFA
jgi:hypothetical protein